MCRVLWPRRPRIKIRKSNWPGRPSTVIIFDMRGRRYKRSPHTVTARFLSRLEICTTCRLVICTRLEICTYRLEILICRLETRISDSKLELSDELEFSSSKLDFSDSKLDFTSKVWRPTDKFWPPLGAHPGNATVGWGYMFKMKSVLCC